MSKEPKVKDLEKIRADDSINRAIQRRPDISSEEVALCSACDRVVLNGCE